MRKTMTVALIIVAMMIATGCAESSSISYDTYSNYETSNNYASSGNYDTSSNVTNDDYFELRDPDGKYVKLSGNVRFVPVEKEEAFIVSETLYMFTFVDLETGNMYLYTEKEVGNIDGRGLGSTFTLLTNTDGTPYMYEDLDSLREFYNYN